MRWIYKLPLRLRSLFRKKHVEQDLNEELRFHLEKLIEENVASGMSAEEARYAALREFGGVEQLKEECRDSWGVRMVNDLAQDVRYGIRQLQRNPGFTAVAVLTLALGIGANTAVFSVVNAVLIKSSSLPYRDAGRLVEVQSGDLREGFDDDVSLADFKVWQARSHVFQRMAAFEGAWFTLPGEPPERVHGDLVSAGWLPTLGVQPLMGRNFDAAEEQPGHDDVAIITNDFWRRRFDGNPKIIGETLTFTDRRRTVIGVLPPDFHFEDREIFVPLVPGQAVFDHSENSMNFHAYARLRREVTLQQAQSEMTAIARRLELQFPATNRGRLLRLVTLKQLAAEFPPTIRRMHRTLWLLFGAVALVMLVACANVSGLLLARGFIRQREFALRTALGSGTGRMIRQLFTEILLLYACGGASGLLLAFWSRNLVVKTMGVYVGNATVTVPVRVDSRVFLFGLGVSLLSGLVFGVAPALQAVCVDLNEALKDSRRVLAGWKRSHIHQAIVVGQMALSLVLLIGFGLLIRSFLRMESASPGFDPHDVVTISAGLEGSGYSRTSERIVLAHEIIAKAASLPAVKSAGITDSLPLEGADGMWFSTEEKSVPKGQQPVLRTVAVTADLFRTMRIPLLEGRTFTDQDTASSPPVVVINQTFARKYFPGETPLGKRIRMEDSPLVWREIVGVIGDVKQRNLDEDSAPIAYRPWNQAPPHELSLAVRVVAPADIPDVAKKLHDRLWSLDKTQVWGPTKTMKQLINRSESVSLRRPIVKLLGFFGILAAIIAAIGIYGLVSYSVTQRTSEIGVRVALGADRSAILALVLRQGALLTATGLGLGVTAAVGLTQLLPAGHIGWTGAAVNLYGVSRTDFLTYAGFSAFLGFVALLACYIPARRAARVDPMVALRYE
jgi:predicted permease